MNIKEAAYRIVDAYLNNELEEKYATAGGMQQTRMARFKQGTADGELRRPETLSASSNEGANNNKTPKTQAGGANGGNGNNKPPSSITGSSYSNSKKPNQNNNQNSKLSGSLNQTFKRLGS